MRRPGVIVLAGLPGAGKSTLAAAIADRLPDVRIIDKDEVRHALFAPCDYTAAERDITFSVMLDAARYHLGRGRIVVFDGLTFSRRTEVAAAEAVAREGDGFVAVIVCDVPVEVAIERCERDAAEGSHAAQNRDGDLVRRVAAEMEEPGGSYLTLPAVRPVAETVELALAYVRECGGSSDD
ncbi:MAG TPA: AAA family ATPase [Acidimicrobiales bacterium]